VLVKGIDFIKSQYPDLIKKHGFRLINNLLNQYNEVIKRGLTRDMFADEYRYDVRGIIINTCTDSAIAFMNEARSLKPTHYHMLGMKKRMRDSVGGEMKGFRDRLTTSKMSSLSICDTSIYIDQLQDLNIPVPQDGEVLDIVFIKPYTLQKSLKSSQKMHLLEYAVKTNQ